MCNRRKIPCTYVSSQDETNVLNNWYSDTYESHLERVQRLCASDINKVYEGSKSSITVRNGPQSNSQKELFDAEVLLVKWGS